MSAHRSLRLLAALLVLASTARAEEPAAGPELGHRVVVTAGYADHTVLDEATTALPYHAPLFVGTLGYAGERPHVRGFANLGAQVGPLAAVGSGDRGITFGSTHPDGETESVTVPMRGQLLALAVDGGAQGVWTVGGGRVDLLAGAAVAWDVFAPQGFAAPGLMQLVSLQPALGTRWRPHARHELELGVRVPVLGGITRMPYHQTVSLPDTGKLGGLLQQGTAFRSLDRLQAVRAEATWRVRVAPRASVGLRYRFAWLHDASPRPLRWVQHTAAVTVDVHL